MRAQEGGDAYKIEKDNWNGRVCGSLDVAMRILVEV